MLRSGGNPLARNWLLAKRSHDVRNNKNQVRVSEVDLHSSAKVPNETEQSGADEQSPPGLRKSV